MLSSCPLFLALILVVLTEQLNCHTRSVTPALVLIVFQAFTVNLTMFQHSSPSGVSPQQRNAYQYLWVSAWDPPVQVAALRPDRWTIFLGWLHRQGCCREGPGLLQVFCWKKFHVFILMREDDKEQLPQLAFSIQACSALQLLTHCFPSVLSDTGPADLHFSEAAATAPGHTASTCCSGWRLWMAAADGSDHSGTWGFLQNCIGFVGPPTPPHHPRLPCPAPWALESNPAASRMTEMDLGNN